MKELALILSIGDGCAYVLVPIESLLWEVIALGVGEDILNQGWEDRLELLESSRLAHVDGWWIIRVRGI